MDSPKKAWEQLGSGLSRRELFRRGGLVALVSGILRGPSAAAATAPATGFQAGPGIYQGLGVRPLINCRGTFTIIGGLDRKSVV